MNGADSMSQSGENPRRVFDLPVMAPADEMAGVVSLAHHGGTRVAAPHVKSPFVKEIT